jgi:STAM-binding protein
MNHSTAQAGNEPKRPASIAELAEMAQMAMLDLWDDTKDFKHYLRKAEKYRKEGREYARKGDIEGAFVELAQAATLVLEKLPMHREYNFILNATQRQNLYLVRISTIISFFRIHFLPLQSPYPFELPDHSSFPSSN